MLPFIEKEEMLGHDNYCKEEKQEFISKFIESIKLVKNKWALKFSSLAKIRTIGLSPKNL